jgi:hypothetical protein
VRDAPGARSTIHLVRRLLKWIVVAVGVAAFVRWWRSRTEPAPLAPAFDAGDPAEELRRTLAESRGAEETPPEEVPAETVDERRADVHEHARAALEEMAPPAGE